MSETTMIEEYAFCAAHRIEEFGESHRDAGLHGHTWTISFEVKAPAVFDHGDLDAAAAGTLRAVDHRVLNDVSGIKSGLNEDLVAVLGVRFGDAMARRQIRATLIRATLTQLSSGRSFRLVRHATTWRPSVEDVVRWGSLYSSAGTATRLESGEG